MVLQNNQFACGQTQLALPAVVEKQRRSVCKALSSPPPSQGAYPSPWHDASFGSARYENCLSWLVWSFGLNGSQLVEVSREKRRQQLMGLSFLAAAVGVMALLTIRLGCI